MVFVLTILEKIKETRLKFFQRSVTVLQKTMTYQKRVKQTNIQLNKSKSAVEKKGAILRLNMKNVEDEELPHELFLTTRIIN